MATRVAHVQEGIERRKHTHDYEAHAEKYARIMYGPFLRELNRIRISGRCLEVGAGPGVMTCLFAQEHPDARVTALDISGEMAARGRERIERLGLTDRVDYQIGDVGDPQVLGRLGEFELVYSTHSMHHWSTAETGLANLLSAVKKGGVLFVGDLARVRWLSWVPSNGGLFTSIRAAYRPREIAEMLENIGVHDFVIRRLFPLYIAVIVRK